MRTLTLDEFQALVFERTHGHPRRVLFVCPMCKSVQGFKELQQAGLSQEQAQQVIGRDCYGRYTGAQGPRMAPDGKPCNWTLYGLLQLHTLEVVTPSGATYAHFELASVSQYAAYYAQQAQAL